ncbi:MAG: hypothetical protein HMLKMBBP_00064 [Planctomycetes bacterium]|nr:hypothetical protein [Planctomycetota bacterium]
MKTYAYDAVLAASEKVDWRVEDLIGGARRLDFTRPFLPESLARTADAPGLAPAERLRMNQIRAHDYLATFGLVEEFILPFVIDHVRPHLSGDDHRVRAFLAFAAEEAKHIHLFKRFREEFRAGFGSECAVIGPAGDVAKAVLSHDSLAVALVILHIEWMTQRHYTESVRDEAGIDPLFESLLRHHWMEEAQHARLDTLMVRSLADGRTEARILSDVREYLSIVETFDGAFRMQAEMNLHALERSTGIRVRESDRAALLAQQHQALRWTFLGSGMTHDEFRATLGALSPAALARVDAAAKSYLPPARPASAAA